MFTSLLLLRHWQWAANRFVKYWEKRRELFGIDKFCLPMTIEGALCDDKVALECGVFTVLPDPDASGRPILYYSPDRNTREGYETESMVSLLYDETRGMSGDKSLTLSARHSCISFGLSGTCSKYQRRTTMPEKAL